MTPLIFVVMLFDVHRRYRPLRESADTRLRGTSDFPRNARDTTVPLSASPRLPMSVDPVPLSVKEQGAGGYARGVPPRWSLSPPLIRWSGTITLSLSCNGLDLKKAIQASIKIPPANMKLLAAGKYESAPDVFMELRPIRSRRFLRDEISLADQGVKATTKILLLKQAQPPAEAKAQQNQEEDKITKLNKTLEVAEELAGRVGGRRQRIREVLL